MAQNEIAHKDGLIKNCVSREEYDAVVAERDMYVKLHEQGTADNASLQSRNASLEGRVAELERIVAERDGTIAALRADKFAPTSEMMDDEEDEPVRLPDSKVEMLALIAGMKHEAEKLLGRSLAQANREEDRKARAGDKKKRKPRTPSARPIGIYTENVAEALGLDMSGLPSNARLLMRGDGPDTWIFRVLFIQRIKTYSKEYRIGRFYVPGEKDMANSAYPPGIHNRCHLSPSFAAFYLRLKISYNVSEQNILRALKAAGCSIPRETLNKYIQRIEKEIRGLLQPAMADEIKESRFTHNDETRLRVKCPDKTNAVVGYHTEYVHGILSPSAKLLLLLYDQGSRGHQVQEEIMKGSGVECFVCDKAKMYPKIVKDIVNASDRRIIRGGVLGALAAGRPGNRQTRQKVHAGSQGHKNTVPAGEKMGRGGARRARTP